MRHFYKYLTVAVLGLSLVLVIKVYAQTPPDNSSGVDLSGIQSLLGPFQNLTNTIDEFLNSFKAKLSGSSLTQKILGYIPQSKDDVLVVLDRFSGVFGGMNRWLEGIVGVNIYGILIVIKNLLIWLINVLISVIRGGISLMH